MLSESIDNLYHVFSAYKKPERLTCFDPTYKTENDVKKLLDYEVRQIPHELMGYLEFYDRGTPAETKYLLPRVMERMTKNILDYFAKNGNSIELFSAISGGGFINGDHLRTIHEWPATEKEAVLNHIYALFDFLFHNTIEIYEFLDDAGYFLDAMPLDVSKLFVMWDNVDPKLRKKQFEYYLEHAYTTFQSNGHFSPMIIKDYDMTRWVVSDKHILEFDFYSHPLLLTMILNDAKTQNSKKMEAPIQVDTPPPAKMSLGSRIKNYFFND